MGGTETRQWCKSCGCISRHITADWWEAFVTFLIINVRPALTAAWQHNLLPVSHRLALCHPAWVAWQSHSKPPASSSSTAAQSALRPSTGGRQWSYTWTHSSCPRSRWVLYRGLGHKRKKNNIYIYFFHFIFENKVVVWIKLSFMRRKFWTSKRKGSAQSNGILFFSF